MDEVVMDSSDDFETLDWFVYAVAHTIARDQQKLRSYLEAAWDEARFEMRSEKGPEAW